MFSSHLTAGLYLVAARRGMCYSSLLTATSCEVVCLEEGKKQAQRCSSVDEPVDEYRMRTHKRRDDAREEQGAGAPAGRSGDQWGRAGSGGGTVRAGVGRASPAGVHELPSRL